jgi:hypothetical protein
MSRRGAFGAAVAIVVAACAVELGGPRDGVLSITNVKLPYPSVVIGDLMRDSLGNPSPLTITAFGANGEEIATVPEYVALDTTLTVDADGTIHGVYRDTVGGRIVASAGGLQTPPQRVIVTIAPTAATAGVDPTTIQFVNTEPDTTRNTNWSPPLLLTLTGATGALAQGYVVTYSLVETPDAEVAGTPTAYIGDDAARSMPRDTTDTKGVSSRRVVIRQLAIANSIRDGSRSDTVIVQASVKYLGADVPGSPVQFIVPVSKKP